MVTPEAATAAWAKLDARWGLMLGQLYPKGYRRDDFLDGLTKIPVENADLLEAVDRMKATRETLYQHDNIVAILGNLAELAKRERHVKQSAAWVTEQPRYELAASRLGLGEWTFGFKPELPDDTLAQRFLRFLVKLRDNPDNGQAQARVKAVATMAAAYVEQAIKAGTDPLDFPAAIAGGQP